MIWEVAKTVVGVRVGYAGEFIATCRSRRGQRWHAVFGNGVKTAACDELNRLLFYATVPTSRTFTLGLIDGAAFVRTATADTAAAHTGWNEFTGYTTFRPVWPQTGSNQGVIDSTAAVTVTVSATGTLKGMFLGSGDLLYSTGEVQNPLPVSVGDTLTLRYRVRAKARAGT